MTREEAIKRIQEHMQIHFAKEPNAILITEALGMAIEALSQSEPCEDYISRAQALSDYADWYGYGYIDNTFYKHLKDMPPVTPQPKMGHWIFDKERLGYWISTCSECGHIFHGNEVLIYKPKFCANCGAKMK